MLGGCRAGSALSVAPFAPRGQPTHPFKPSVLCCRLPLTRPEMALSLLVEVAYDHDEEFRQHLPQVCVG